MQAGIHTKPNTDFEELQKDYDTLTYDFEIERQQKQNAINYQGEKLEKLASIIQTANAFNGGNISQSQFDEMWSVLEPYLPVR